jgi:hypothetical protein
MRFRCAENPDHYRIFVGNKEVGHIRPGVVTFGGFVSEPDAKAAADATDRALTERRLRAEGEWGIALTGRPSIHDGVPPAVVSRSSETGLWRIESRLHRSEQAPVFAMSRARMIWDALEDRWRASG